MSADQSADPMAGAHMVERAAGLLEMGGPVLTILAVLSVVTLALILIKLWQFTAARLFQRRLLQAALETWRSGRHREAMEQLEGSRHPGAEVVLLAMRGRWDRGQEEATLREEVTRHAVLRLEALRSYLRGLEVIGVLSPLLGLLGTVLGMIEAFRQLEMAGSRVDPALLSGGIWEALLTTAAGLALAIPAVAALTWLERIVERFRHRVEDAVTQVFTTPPPAAAPQEAVTARSDAGEDEHGEPYRLEAVSGRRVVHAN